MKSLNLKWGIGASILCALSVVLFAWTKLQDTYIADERDASIASASEEIIMHQIKCHEISGIELLDIMAVKLHNMNLPIKIKVLGKGETEALESAVFTLEYEDVRLTELLDRISEKSGVKLHFKGAEIVFSNS